MMIIITVLLMLILIISALNLWITHGKKIGEITKNKKEAIVKMDKSKVKDKLIEGLALSVFGLGALSFIVYGLLGR